MSKYIYNQLGCYSGLLSLQHFARLRLALRPLALFPENLIITFAQIRVRMLSDPIRSALESSVPRPYNPTRPSKADVAFHATSIHNHLIDFSFCA
jgi:hypothetical protein